MKLNKQSRYRVKSSTSYKTFDGIKKVESDFHYTFHLSNKKSFSCTANHRFVVGKISRLGKVVRRAQKLKVGNYIGNGIKIRSIEVFDTTKAFYDLINVEGDHTYNTPNGLEHHNCDEMAWIEEKKIKGFLDSAMPSLSAGKDTKIIFVSTANGYNEFHKYAINAKSRNDTTIECKDLNGFVYREYDYKCVEGRDEAWFDKKVKEEGILSANRNYRVKFLGSADTLVDAQMLLDIQGGQKKPIDTLDIAHHEFNIYEQPIFEDHIVYTIGVDSSKISSTAKKNKSDNSSVQVLKVDLRERHLTQVATLYTKDLHYTDLSEICYRAAEYYKDAWVMIENNSEGQAVVDDLFSSWDYGNIYTSSSRNDVFGFRTTTTTRNIGVGNLKKLLKKGALTLWDEDTINELFTFVRNSKGKYEAQSTDDHDDAIMAIIAAIYWLQDNLNEFDITLKEFLDKNNELETLQITENVAGSGDEDLSGLFFATGSS